MPFMAVSMYFIEPAVPMGALPLVKATTLHNLQLYNPKTLNDLTILNCHMHVH